MPNENTVTDRIELTLLLAYRQLARSERVAYTAAEVLERGRGS